MTKYELANKVGVTHQAVYAWYNGQRFPSTKNILKMSKVLNISVEELSAQFEKAILERKKV